MPWEGFACYSGTEIVNNARAAAYGRVHGISVRCSGDPWLAPSLGHWPYISPDHDDAPWFDPSVPDSKGFLGVLGMSVTGGDGTAVSAWTDLLEDGARPGPLRRSAREVLFTADLIAVDKAALSYGLGWLASVLRGELCDTACDADVLQLYAAPPAPPPTAAGCAPEPVFPKDGFDPARRGDELERTLYQCRLLEGPTQESIAPIRGGVMSRVTWTIKAGIPYWYHRPAVVWTLSETRPEDYFTRVVGNWNSQKVYTDCAEAVDDNNCLVPPPDANYPCPPLTVPVVATPPRDPCYKGDFYRNGWQTLYRIPPGVAPSWFEKTPIIELDNGNRQIRSLLIRWRANPLGLPPTDPDHLDPCGVCAELWIPYLPPFAKLLVDGRRQVATVECVGDKRAEPVLYGKGGGIYAWPVLECSTAMFLELVTDGDYGESKGLDLTISLAARQDAC